MASPGYSRNSTWPLLIGVFAIAACAWGLYAWRFAADSAPPPSDGPSTLLRADGAKPEGEAASHDEPSPPVNTGVVSDSGVVTENTPTPGPAEPAPESGLGRIRPELATDASGKLQGGRDALAAGDLITARSALSAALDRGLEPADEGFARTELARISDALLFSRTVAPDDPLTLSHTVAPGESIAVIAGRYRITPELLVSTNHIVNPHVIHAGAPLKVIRGPFDALIDKSEHRMDIYLGAIYVRSYPVGLGSNSGTPTGSWIVKNKLINPEWSDPSTGQLYLADDPNNPIGERWIGLLGESGEAAGRTGYGIHGTIDPKSIGENRSMGCIRLLADDVAQVFDLLLENVSRVVVRP